MNKTTFKEVLNMPRLITTFTIALLASICVGCVAKVQNKEQRYQPKFTHYTKEMNRCLACSSPTYAPAHYKIHGDFVTVDGEEIWVERYGSGSPSIVLLNGGGDTIREWNKNIPTLAQHTTVIGYDRQGLGRTPLINKDIRTAKAVIERLHKLLQKIDAKPPYILVAHSIGGLYASYFSRKYPDEIAGIVTLDGNNRFEVFWDQLDKSKLSTKERTFLKKYMKDNAHPKKVTKESQQLLTKPQLTATEQAKLIEYLEIMGKPESAREIERLGALPKVPLIAITETSPQSAKDPEANLWRTAMYQFSQEVPCSEFKVIQHSGHYSMIDQPKIINNAILRVLQFAREKRSLCVAT
ncbi:alpha/beta hydrolase [Cysteiniphilum sp. QT6929]|uniref:alpha/beta fold hydrolase n=1 Tax=Cysteiniphilum sp. QT6929 TaxID=2975055 RepID=UPI0024B3B029|nr:alpha/beta hydrolase [Cysteiniphilum sp. QT6929]WHN65966.1 alpha/beta hydrolase [Cysteiniphilum sp. QT6929]